ncbi:hypothetical protein [Nonomuraea sp. NPDC049480]|uniref:hypothetical protein n=1 Tax=Nonomuraea sp. NPDC049480 TaxID=3364353 RepID=UPI0037A6CF50
MIGTACEQAEGLGREKYAQLYARIDELAAELAAASPMASHRAPADLDAIARYYTTVVQDLSVQARDGATRAELEAVTTYAMAAWASSACSAWSSTASCCGTPPTWTPPSNSCDAAVDDEDDM